MRFLFTFSFLVAALGTYAQTSSPIAHDEASLAQFVEELEQLQTYFAIPGMAALVQQGDSLIFEHYNGFSDMESQEKVGPQSVFPIASLTKIFSGILILKLVEEEKLSLDDPANTYVADAGLGDSILVRHLLSHTSQGKVGEHFYYSWRFGYLTPIIQQAAGMPLADYVQQAILNPLQMEETYIMEAPFSDDNLPAGMTMPYDLDDSGKPQPGHIEWGFSASAGLASTGKDLLKLSKALDENTLISASSKAVMFSSPKKGLPYGHGIFNDEARGLKWGYGQYDSYSSLFLKVPEQDLTLILLANSNLLSDPPRLINGDPLSSLFVLSFLQCVVSPEFHNPILPQLTPLQKTSALEPARALAKAKSAAFMARYDNAQYDISTGILDAVFEAYPACKQEADLNLLFTLTFLKDVAFYKELGPLSKYDSYIETIGTNLLKEDPHNPYAHVLLGGYFDRKEDLDRARVHFQAIVESPNLAKFWYTQNAQNWLETHPK